MRRLLAVLALPALLSCTSATAPDTGVRVRLGLDRTTATGADVIVSITNGSTVPIVADGCGGFVPGIERYDGTGWVSIRPIDVVCLAIYMWGRPVAVGESVRVTVPLAQAELGRLRAYATYQFVRVPDAPMVSRRVESGELDLR
jgi:hypothetical protein